MLFQNLFEFFAQKTFERRSDRALLTSGNGTDGVGRVTKGLKRDQFQTRGGLGGVGKEFLRNLIGAEFRVLFRVTDLMRIVVFASWNEEVAGSLEKSTKYNVNSLALASRTLM